MPTKSTLVTLAEKIRVCLDSRSAISYFNSGRYLSQAKELLSGRGNFERWRKKCFPKRLSPKNVRNRLNSYIEFNKVPTTLLRKFHTTAMGMLAQKGPDAVAEALRQAAVLGPDEYFDIRRAIQITERSTVIDERGLPPARKIIAAIRQAYGKTLSLDRVHQLLEDACCAYETIEAVASTIGTEVPADPHEAMQHVYGLFELNDKDEWTIRNS